MGHCAVVASAPLTAVFPLFVFQSSRAREVHQVSIWATPITPFRDTSPVLQASPSDQPPFWPVLRTCVRGGEDGAPRSSPETRVHPGPSGRLLILPAQPAPRPILSAPMLVHPSQDPRHDCPYAVSFRELKYVIQRFAEDPRQEVRPPRPWRAHRPAAGRLPGPLGHPDSSHGPPAFAQTQPPSRVSEPSP